MWFLLGFITGWFLFAKPSIDHTGIVLFNSNEEVLLTRKELISVWEFPTYFFVPQNVSYLDSAITKFSEQTSLYSDVNYTLLSGGCKYATTFYFFGTLAHPDSFTPGSDALQWFSIHSLPNHTWPMQLWIEDGMPVSCGNDEL